MTTKAAQMAKVSAKGSVHLLWGIVASTVISAVGTIFIANLLGPDNYGLYAIALAAPSLIGNFRDWGINTAAVKYTAQYNSENDSQKIKNVFTSTLLFELALGTVLSLLSFALSGFLATTFSRPGITLLIQISSFAILTNALINVATSAFTGMEKMHLNSVMLIVQSIVKTGVIIGLVLLGLGTVGAMIGYTVAVLVAGLVGILLAYTMYKSLPKQVHVKPEILGTIKLMLKYGLPVSVGAIFSGFLLQFYTWIMAIYVTDNASIGNYNVALNFVVLITFFATPVTTMMFPAFSKLDSLKDKETLKNVFQFSVKYASIIIVPVTFLVMVLAQPAIATIFQNKYVEAPLFLALLSISYLYTALGNLSSGNLINGQGYTTFNLILTILTAAIGFPLGFVLISTYGIMGLIITSLAAGLPSLFLSLYFIKKHFQVSVDWVSSTKIIFSSGIAALLTYLLIIQLALSNLILLGIGVFAFVIIFVLIAVVTKTINLTDIGNIREIVNSLGPLRKPLSALINVIERLIKLIRY
jgi:O-antigen/teichoic acid export membrane protein